MQSKMFDEYKSYIKILYFGIDKKSFSSSEKKYLYRGAKINKSEKEKIMNYKKEGKIKNIIVFSKAYLSFSEEENEALNFVGTSDKETQGVLYILDNSMKDRIESNANIQEFSAFPEEKEILFFPGSCFVINDIIGINNGIVKIILNYYGKFKEYYNFFSNQEKLNVSNLDIDINDIREFEVDDMEINSNSNFNNNNHNNKSLDFLNFRQTRNSFYIYPKINAQSANNNIKNVKKPNIHFH